jgi:hypothetical protein
LAAVNLHRLAEERSLAFHRRVAEKLASDPAILARARARVDEWLQAGSVASVYATEWARLLAASPSVLSALLEDPSEHARALRQVTPFAGALSPRERWRIWREVAEANGRAP